MNVNTIYFLNITIFLVINEFVKIGEKNNHNNIMKILNNLLIVGNLPKILIVLE